MQNLVLRETEKEHQGEDFYGIVVPASPVENVLPVAAYDVLLRIESSCKVFTAIRVHSLHRSLYRLLQYEGTIERYCTLYSVQ